MKCLDVNLMLDARGFEALSAPEKHAADLHFASCNACRDAWAVYREIAAQEPPKTSNDLPLRVATALAAAATPAETRWLRRSLLGGGVLVIGAAMAAGIATLVADRASDLTQDADTRPRAEAPASPLLDAVPEPSAPVAGNGAGSGSGSQLPPRGAGGAAATFALDKQTVSY
jgi:hypothetical protein